MGEVNTLNEIRKQMERFRVWYHKIDLGNGLVTPGRDYDPLWDNIRASRNCLDYKGKNVLDLGSWDGMWAFEAEKLGANIVVATDCRYEAYDNLLFCKNVLKSKVMPLYNVSPYCLTERLDVFFQENWLDQKPYERMFDIVQHLGLLYHVRDPMTTLSQSRSCLRTGGYLLVETGAVVNDDSSYMLFNGVPPDKQRIYDDVTTWWAPTINCLKEMLRASLFEPIEASIQIMDKNIPATPEKFVSRVCMVAKAVSIDTLESEYKREISRTYRNPGLSLELLKQGEK